MSIQTTVQRRKRMITFTTPHGIQIPYLPDMTPTGYLPLFFSDDDPSPAREQVDKNYAHGGGWFPFKGMELSKDRMTMVYPANKDGPAEVYRLVAKATLHHEELFLYMPGAWLAIVQPDGSFEVGRVD